MDPQYKDILMTKKPPYIPELDDPSFTYQMFNRDIPYGYEVLIENLMDPSHVPYAHYGILKSEHPSVKLDREGGSPIDLNIQKIDKNGFTTTEPDAIWNFVPPCLFHGDTTIGKSTDNVEGKKKPPLRVLLIFICIPVSPGNSRMMFIFPRNFALWIARVVPRWIQHIGQNLIIDSDLCLLHEQEKKLINFGQSNWQKVCFVPTKADANVAAYRKWIKKYAGGQIDWGNKFNEPLPPTPPRDRLLDRYWSHVVNCSCCNGAYKGLNALKVALQVFSVALVAMVAATKQGMISVAARNMLAVAALLCFVGSKWLSHFIYKNFHFHDYIHAFK